MSSAFEGLPKTPNLSLNKPGYDNVADIEALNENSDILDDEINTIKSNLKNKGSATEPIYFDGNGVPQKTKNFTDYLPLAGGTMTGAIETNGDIINPSNNNTFIRIKGSKEYQQGAELLLSGKTLTDHEGLFYLIANNGTKSTKLLGKADGNLLWGAKHIVRSVNGINATPDGNINLGIIPIANGGTGANNAENARNNLGLSYATQAEAEVGESNAKSMTPLQTKNAIDKQRQVVTYNSLASVGLSVGTETIADIANALTGNGVMLCYYTTSANAKIYPTTNGVVEVVRATANRIAFRFIDNLGDVYVGFFANNTFIGWKKLAKKGALSMPSAIKIEIAIPESGGQYTVPADGWVTARATTTGGGGFCTLNNMNSGISGRCIATTGNVGVPAYVPAAKGDIVTLTYGAAKMTQFTFIYAQSEV